MSTALDPILTNTRDRVIRDQADLPKAHLEEIVKTVPKPRGFINALVQGRSANPPSIIAEIKQASPSRGVIRPDFDPVFLAHAYETGGATCLSVLTEPSGFQGCDADLQAARAAVSLPVLRKDFMIDPYQITQSRAIGADCVLLIAAALEDSLLADLYHQALDYGMDVLVEVHKQGELDRALRLQPRMVGVNARDLTTLTMHPDRHDALLPLIPQDCIKVAESGISDPLRLKDLQAQGYDAFLVGESLLRTDNPARGLKALLDHAS